jgi:hypothetical protein
MNRWQLPRVPIDLSIRGARPRGESAQAGLHSGTAESRTWQFRRSKPEPDASLLSQRALIAMSRAKSAVAPSPRCEVPLVIAHDKRASKDRLGSTGAPGICSWMSSRVSSCRYKRNRHLANLSKPSGNFDAIAASFEITSISSTSGRSLIVGTGGQGTNVKAKLEHHCFKSSRRAARRFYE